MCSDESIAGNAHKGCCGVCSADKQPGQDEKYRCSCNNVFCIFIVLFYTR